MEKTLRCEVLVVGAGIAGIVAALKLAKLGKDVILIEKLPKVGSHNNKKIDITESTNIDSIIQELRLPYLGKFNRSVWHTPSNKFEFVSKVNDYYIMRGNSKDSFETLLVPKLKKAGVRLITNANIRKIERDGNGISSITFNVNGIIRKVSALYYVAADGHNSDILREFRGQSHDDIELMGYGFIYDTLAVNENETHVFFDKRYAPGGYFYLGKVKGMNGICCVVVNKRLQKKPLSDYYSDFIVNNQQLKEIISNSKQVNKFVGAGKIGKLATRVIGNLVLVGDAGRTMDPIFGYGVRQAIFTGYHAAIIVGNSISTGQNNLVEYDKLLNEKLLGDLDFELKVRKVFDRMNNHEFDELFQLINKIHGKVHLDELLDRPQDYLFEILVSALSHPLITAKIMKRYFL